MHQPVEEETNIKFIRMNTGEDVLAELVTKKMQSADSSAWKDFHFLINPLKVVYGLTPKKDGVIITLAQWVMDSICTTQEFSVDSKDILLIAEPSQEILQYYHDAIERNLNSKTQKMREMHRREVDLEEELELIPDEEMEFLKSVIEGLKDNKRKLH